MITNLFRTFALTSLILSIFNTSYAFEKKEGHIALPLVYITNNAETTYTWFGVIIDPESKNILAMYKDRHYQEKEQETEQFLYDLSDVAHDEGVAISSRKGIDVVKVSSSNFDPTYGGDVTLTYFKIVRTSKKKSIPITVERDGDRWAIYHEGKKVKEMFFKVNRKLGVVYGVKKIEFTYDEES